MVKYFKMLIIWIATGFAGDCDNEDWNEWLISFEEKKSNSGTM